MAAFAIPQGLNAEDLVRGLLAENEVRRKNRFRYLYFTDKGPHRRDLYQT